MVNTKKFSDFSVADINDSSTQNVGLTNGLNTRENKFYRWTTASRPTIPFNGLLGYNLDIQQYEYWDSVLNVWIQMLTNNSAVNWSIITAVSVNASINSGYITNRSSTPVTVLLPPAFLPGNFVEIMGLGAGGWSLVANAGQKIVFGSVETSIAGAINSDIQYSNIIVRGLVENSVWSVISINSNPTII